MRKVSDEVILAVIGEKIEISLKKMVELYVKRWNIEVTFRECRDHLGIETQRQWSDLAIIRSTPLLFCMYTIIVIIGNNLWSTRGIEPLKTAWYDKKHLTFSDLLQSVRLELWKHKSDSREKDESKKNISMEEALFEHLAVMGV